MYSNIINRTININHQVHNDQRSDKSIYVETLFIYGGCITIICHSSFKWRGFILHAS